MDEIKQEQLDKFKDIAQILDRDTVTQEEFVEMFGVLIDFVGQIKESNESDRVELDGAVNKSLAELHTVSSRIEQRVAAIRNGEDYKLTEQDKKEIATFIDVPVVEKIIQHTETIKEQPVVKEVAIPETPDETVDKVNNSTKLIRKERIEGLVDLISNVAHSVVGSFPVTTSFFNGLRAKNMTVVGATAVQRGDTVFVTPTGGSGGGQVNSVVAGTGISVDSTDPANPIVSATGSSTGYQGATGTVDGVNTAFTFVVAPNAIVVDGVSIRKVATDTTVNWTGTTNITLAVAPTFDIYAVA